MPNQIHTISPSKLCQIETIKCHYGISVILLIRAICSHFEYMSLCASKEEELSGIPIERLSTNQIHNEIKREVYVLQLIALEAIQKIVNRAEI